MKPSTQTSMNNNTNNDRTSIEATSSEKEQPSLDTSGELNGVKTTEVIHRSSTTLQPSIDNSVTPSSDQDQTSSGRITRDFNSFYGITEGEVPENTTKTATGVPGVELWVIPQSLAQDPVQFHYWLVTGKGKYAMDDENVSQVLTDVNFSPKSEADALAVSKLVFYEPRLKIVEADNISNIRSRVPENIKDQVRVPKITKEGEYYIVELGVYYHESLQSGGSSDFYTIYTHKIGPSYFKRLSSNVLWMPDLGV